MGQTLFDLLTGLNLEIYPADDWRQQALSTVAVENLRGWRIAKEKASKKIDAIVALAMASVAAMAHRGELGSRAARGFNQAAHVPAQAVTPFRGLVYIGQTFEVPATVIAQENRGAIYVLAAFANEQMSLRRLRDSRQAVAGNKYPVDISRPPATRRRLSRYRSAGAMGACRDSRKNTRRQLGFAHESVGEPAR